MAPMLRVYDLKPDVRDELIGRIAAGLSDCEDLSFAVVFGSFLEDQSAAPSLDRDLAATLSLRLGFPIDVRRINDAPVPFLFHVLRGRVVAARDPERMATLMERTARDYHDRAPLLRRATREAFSG